MAELLFAIRRHLDLTGIVLGGLCLVHCLATILVVSALGLGGQLLLSPEIHRFGLLLALIVAAVAIGGSALRHRRAEPFVTAMMGLRSEEHTSELQSLMRISYAVFCLKTKNKKMTK